MTSQLVGRFKQLGGLFVLCVVIPTLGALLYFGFFASDVYISESRFVVRSPDKPAPSSFSFLLKSTGFGNAGDEIFAAQSFVTSRDALTQLNRDRAVEKAYTRPTVSIFDRFNPLGLSGSFESLYRFYRNRVSIDYDTSSSITTLSVRAYTSDDAYRMNVGLLGLAEGLVNRLNTRARQDLIEFSSGYLDEARRKANAAALELSQFRNQEGVIDPEKQATVQIQMISKLQDSLIATHTQLAELQAYTPQNPQIAVLKVRIRELSGQIDEELDKVAGSRRSLSSKAARYQRLQLESQFADRQLGAAMASRDEAMTEARRKQAYVERIVQPNRPDEALEPRRLRGILATFALGLVAWGILRMLLAGVREHAE
ncbi:hypothetical protein [Novosphingobium sp.]|uniref:hypothetical protein n=1 Tax=Novosphingobium sp. TaxID=1874826 RepID=UPI0025D38A94|nr:hypothetical protein [Novosphingobium sp.]